MDWNSVDWNALERLRAVFLSGAYAGGPYWTNSRDLESYDFTFGRRIAWKWAAVIPSLIKRGWTPPARQLVDWGCGTAITARSILAYCGPESFDEVVLWDLSPVATTYAKSAISSRYPDVRVQVADPDAVVTDGNFILLISHVLNELDATGRATLLKLAARAAAILWIEPGTSDDSRALIAAREELRDTFHCLAPCTHNEECGMLAPENTRHWCHHFARVPTEAFTEKGWAQFSRRLGIDIRSLPYSHLVLDRRPPSRADGLARVIGEPRRGRGIMKILRCRHDGVAEVELQERESKTLWRTLEKGRHDGVFVWEELNGRIRDGQP